MQNVLVDKLIELALMEDLVLGDPTSDALFEDGRSGEGSLMSREPLVFCGGPFVSRIMALAEAKLSFEPHVEEGASVGAATRLGVLKGSYKDLLKLERIVLNFIQHLSGIATRTRSVINKAAGLVVLDTRKTTPGWRHLEKYATRVGGAKNHRFCLGDLVMIKDNHLVAYKGQLALMFEKLNNGKAAYLPIEVEVENILQLEEVIPYKPNVVMLDNFSESELQKAVALIRAKCPEARVEVSGGVTEASFQNLAKLGVDFVSMGSLISKATKVDIALDVL